MHSVPVNHPLTPITAPTVQHYLLVGVRTSCVNRINIVQCYKWQHWLTRIFIRATQDWGVSLHIVVVAAALLAGKMAWECWFSYTQVHCRMVCKIIPCTHTHSTNKAATIWWQSCAVINHGPSWMLTHHLRAYYDWEHTDSLTHSGQPSDNNSAARNSSWASYGCLRIHWTAVIDIFASDNYHA